MWFGLLLPLPLLLLPLHLCHFIFCTPSLPHLSSLPPSSPLASTLLFSSTNTAAIKLGTTLGQDAVCANIADELKCIADKVDSVVEQYDGYFEEILKDDDDEAMKQAFLKVGGEVFRSGITTQRIVVLLLFGYKLVKLFLRKVAQKVTGLLPSHVTDFIILAGKFVFAAFMKYQVLSWVREQGGWQNLAPSISWATAAFVVGAMLIVFGFVARFWR